MLAESFVLAIIGSLIGIGAAAGFLIIYQDYITYTLQVPLIIPSALTLLAGGAISLFLAFGIAGVSSLYPAYLVIHSEPFDTIRRGGV
jgi:ABC-type lipoprotein release transport system permease subunit